MTHNRERLARGLSEKSKTKSVAIVADERPIRQILATAVCELMVMTEAVEVDGISFLPLSNGLRGSRVDVPTDAVSVMERDLVAV